MRIPFMERFQEIMLKIIIGQYINKPFPGLKSSPYNPVIGLNR